MNIMLYI